MVIVGLGNKAIDEAKERIRSAFLKANIPFPRKRITINLAPADLPKDSTSFDMAIAAAILRADGQCPTYTFSSQEVFVGELGLSGRVRPVRGIIGKIMSSKQAGIETFFIPKDNLEQACLVPDVRLYVFSTIQELYDHLTGKQPITEITTKLKHRLHKKNDANPFSDVVGQEQAKRALTIAAAGGHNIFLSGPPGTGKSMLAKTLPALLPPMSNTEILESTQLHSLASNRYDEIVFERPFRAPHHSASHIAVVGGGQYIKPGEISLSHNGVLLLDEMPEFSRATLEALRQPLEDRTVTISRAKQTIVFPAHFILIATANPCPCGYLGSEKLCICSPRQVVAYQQRVSGPIMDRIDLHVTVDKILHAQLLTTKDNAPPSQLDPRPLIQTALHRQHDRFKTKSKNNAGMTNKELGTHAAITPQAKAILDTAANKLAISARSYMRIIKVARTIADIEDADSILPSHITEALQYRRQHIRP